MRTFFVLVLLKINFSMFMCEGKESGKVGADGVRINGFIRNIGEKMGIWYFRSPIQKLEVYFLFLLVVNFVCMLKLKEKDLFRTEVVFCFFFF